MKTIFLHDKTEIASVLRRNVFLHIYSIGDLDDFFWKYTTWYAFEQDEEVRAIVLLYTGLSLPTLVALSDDMPTMRSLLGSALHLLPQRFYAHLSPGLEAVLEEAFRLTSHGEHYKMALRDRLALDVADTSAVVRLSEEDLEEILRLYEASYPGNWFDPRMLETGQYFGIWGEEGLVSIAGVHVYSRAYRVAALGNITTHPDHRGRGLGRSVTAKLCTSLCEDVDHIGLNVKTDNRSAVSLYSSIRFEVIASYGEYMVETR